MVESARLEFVWAFIASRGFESHPLRQPPLASQPIEEAATPGTFPTKLPSGMIPQTGLVGEVAEFRCLVSGDRKMMRHALAAEPLEKDVKIGAVFKLLQHQPVDLRAPLRIESRSLSPQEKDTDSGWSRHDLSKALHLRKDRNTAGPR